MKSNQSKEYQIQSTKFEQNQSKLNRVKSNQFNSIKRETEVEKCMILFVEFFWPGMFLYWIPCSFSPLSASGTVNVESKYGEKKEKEKIGKREKKK